ncbi:MAG: hypothetical protein K5853_09290 [Lachnospiraceae bacterium]|nr:hypothetical protein [Lachnospiraceae bacterium]
MNIFGIILFFILTFAVPFVIGTAFVREESRFATDGYRSYVFGMLLMLAVFEVLSVLFTFAHWRFSMLCVLYSAVLVLLCGSQMWSGRFFRIWKRTPAGRGSIGKSEEAVLNNGNTDRAGLLAGMTVERRIVVAVVLVLMLVEISLLVFFQSTHFGDNYFHTAAMTDAIEKDYMWSVDPANGWNTYVNVRYKLGGWDMFLAYLAKLCGMKAPMLCYTFLPIFAYPWFYMTAALLAHGIFDRAENVLSPKLQERGVKYDGPLYADYFMLFFAVLMLFGYHNMVEAQTYFSSMPWTGRSIVYGPCAFLMFYLVITKFPGEKFPSQKEKAVTVDGMTTVPAGISWTDAGEIFLLNFASLSMSLTSMLTLLPIEVGIYILFCIKRRKLFSFWKIAFTLIPFALGAGFYAGEYVITLLYYISIWL